MTKKYITTAIDYVNSPPHIGTAYEKIGADVLARYYRLMGYDVVFQMGNDEHSTNVYKAAKEKGMDPKGYCDFMRPKFEEAWKHLEISYDQFIQTSEPRHHKAVKKLFQKIHDAGDIYPKDYEGWYCESCEAFYTEKDLIEGLCPNHKAKPKWLKEKNYFFKLTKYSDFLLDHIKKNPNFILPEKRRNEVVQFIKQGLVDVSVSRSSVEWGIPLPIQEDHVIYVWFDALINYITGIGFGDDEAKFEENWQNVLHVIGKDITRFHCIIWPAMLQSAGLKLPDTILGHGFVYLKGEKMSKTLGNVVSPLDILEKYPDFGGDALRYYLMRGSSFGDDGDFTWDSFIERYNADLANGYGNLVSRTLGMVWRYQDGEVKPLPSSAKEELDLLSAAGQVFEKVSVDLDPEKNGDTDFHLALEKIWAYMARVDQYIDRTAPWTLAKGKKADELSIVLTTITEAIRLISVMLFPFIPLAVSKVWRVFGFEVYQELSDVRGDVFQKDPYIKDSHKFQEKKLMLFPRIEAEKESKVEGQKSKVEAKKEKVKEEGLIDIKDFSKVDLRVAKILKVEKVEGADKLLKLQIELGEDKRQIVAGIAEHYTPEDLVGKSIIVVANLKPAEIRGVDSNGMLLAAKKGKSLVLIAPEGEINSNAKVG